jgi:hypothetical protein
MIWMLLAGFFMLAGLMKPVDPTPQTFILCAIYLLLVGILSTLRELRQDLRDARRKDRED